MDNTIVCKKIKYVTPDMELYVYEQLYVVCASPAPGAIEDISYENWNNQ